MLSIGGVGKVGDYLVTLRIAFPFAFLLFLVGQVGLVGTRGPGFW